MLRWAEYELVARATSDVVTPNGRTARIVAEVRRPGDTHHLKLRVGREGPPISKDEPGVPNGPEIWYEDFRGAMDAAVRAFLEAAPAYIEGEIERQRESVRRNAERVESAVTLPTDDWRVALGEMAPKLGGILEAMESDVDVASEEICDRLEEHIGDL